MIRGRTTMIPVVLKDGTSKQVFPEVLDSLLDADRVVLFRRSSGWVLVGHDPVRSGFGPEYRGEERRGSGAAGSH